MACATDRAILNAIFNPLLPTGECLYEEDIPAHLKGDDEESLALTSLEAKQLELEAIESAENGNIMKSIAIFTKAIELAPSHASLYNNRAQAYRLVDNIEGALSDLNNAINLSNKKGKSGCQALVQRGLIYLHQEKKAMALQDLKTAAELGSQFAKAMLAQINPYAALCNQMLEGMFAKLLQGGDA